METTEEGNREDRAQAKEKVMGALDFQIDCQWRLEKKNRRYYHGILWVQWLCSLAIILLSVFQTQITDPLERGIIFTIALLSTLSLTATGLSSQFKFQQRQQIHDEVARACDIIKLKLELDQITFEQALDMFEALHKHPTEKSIRDMA